MLKKKINIKNKIQDLFLYFKIKKGDNLLIHSNIAGIFQFSQNKDELRKNLKLFFDSLLEFVGKKGTILFPAYNYDFAKGKVFDPYKSPSQVGELANYLNFTYPGNRTNEPIFSHIVFGKLQKKIFRCDNTEAFGDKSVFNLILKKNFKIICFCCSPSSMTFIHFLEKKFKVKYRFNKYFNSSIIINNNKLSIRYKYYVGKKKINYSVKEEKIINLLDKKLTSKNLGKFNCYKISAKLLHDAIKKKLKKDNYYLIKK